MGAQGHLIGELQDVMENRDPSGRADVLRRVTDLFIDGSGRFTDDQIELFGDVMSRLVGTIGRAARAEFGSRLALVSDAPADVIRMLAFDDAIEVAAPVLAFSGRLEDAALAENARTKSQGHLRRHRSPWRRSCTWSGTSSPPLAPCRYVPLPCRWSWPRCAR